MSILVTGAAGFIGSSLAQRLTYDGHQVVGIDNFNDYYDPKLKLANLSQLGHASGFEMIKADLNDVDLVSLIQDAEVIYHLAGQPGVRRSWGANFTGYVDANIRATQRLLEAVYRHANRLERFIYASSSSVYGDAPRYPTRESDNAQPRSPYGVTKLAGEHLVSLYAANFGLPCISLRFFTVYGPRQRPDMAFNRFISSALRGGSLEVHGDGTQIREFTYVDDIVDANILSASVKVQPGAVINLSGGASVSLNDVLGILEKIHGSQLRINRGLPVPGDVFRTGGCTELAGELLQWRPKIGIEDGLAREYAWLAGSDR